MPSQISKQNITNFHISFILSIFYIIMLYFTPNIFGLLEPDSSGYIYFSSIRPATYPLFIKIIHYFNFGLKEVILLQCIFFSTSILYLIYTFLNLKISKLLIISLYFSLFLNIYYNGFHHVILTESISFSLIIFFLGSFISYVYKKEFFNLFIFILSLSILFTIKPAGFSILITSIISISIFTLIIEKNKIKPFILLVLCPVIIVIGLENVAFYSFHEKRDSILKTHFFGKAMMMNLIAGEEKIHFQDYTVKDEKILTFFNEAAPYLKNLERLNHRCLMYERYGDFENYAYNLQKKDFSIAREIFQKHFFKYLTLTKIHYLNFFCVASPIKYKNYFDKPPLIPQDGFGEKYRKYIIHLSFLILGGLFFVASAYYFLLIFYKMIATKTIKKNEFINIALIFITHNYFLFVSALSISNPRYLMLVFPILIFITLQFSIEILEKIKKQFKILI